MTQLTGLMTIFIHWQWPSWMMAQLTIALLTMSPLTMSLHTMYLLMTSLLTMAALTMAPLMVWLCWLFGSADDDPCWSVPLLTMALIKMALADNGSWFCDNCDLLTMWLSWQWPLLTSADDGSTHNGPSWPTHNSPCWCQWTMMMEIDVHDSAHKGSTYNGSAHDSPCLQGR